MIIDEKFKNYFEKNPYQKNSVYYKQFPNLHPGVIRNYLSLLIKAKLNKESQMNSKSYWLFIITKENWTIVKKLNIIGSNYTKKITPIKKEDEIIIYLIRPVSSFVGNYRVISKFKSNKKIFNKGIYQFRLNIEPIFIPKNPRSIIKLIDKLNFIRNKNHWQGHFLGVRGVMQLAKDDYETIYNIIKSN